MALVASFAPSLRSGANDASRATNKQYALQKSSYSLIQKIAPQAKSGKHLQIWFFPQFGEKNGGVLSMRMQVILAPVVQRLDNAIHRINHYPADSMVCFVNIYPRDSDLSGG